MDVCLGLTCWKPDLAQPDDDFISLSYLKAAASLSRKQSLFPLCLTPQDVGITLQIPLPVYKSWLLAAWQKKNKEIWRLGRKRFVFFTYLKLQIKCVCVFIRGWQVKLAWLHLDFCWLFLYILLFDVIEFSRSYWLALKQHYSFSQTL